MTTRILQAFFQSLTKKKKVRQIIFLYSSMVLGLAVGILISMINTRYLGPKLYGDFKFVLSVYTLTASIFTLGIFYSASRLIIQKKHADIKRRIIGVTYIIGIGLSIVYGISIFGFSFFEEIIYDNKLGYIIRILAPFAFALPLDQLSQNLLQGDNKIYDLALYRILQKLSYLIIAYIYNFVIGLSLYSALFIYFTSYALTILYAVLRLKPTFNLDRKIISTLKVENKAYGMQVYFGTMFSFATAQMGAIVIGYYIDTTNVGFYSLALTATLPLTLIPSTHRNNFF